LLLTERSLLFSKLGLFLAQLRLLLTKLGLLIADGPLQVTEPAFEGGEFFLNSSQILLSHLQLLILLQFLQRSLNTGNFLG